jgi:acyl dehydratase
MAVSEAALLELQRAVGAHRTDVLGEVTALMISRYARAVGDSDPLYVDAAFARAHGHTDVIAPPNLVTGVVGWGDGGPEDRLREDGTEIGEHLPGIPDSGFRLMGGGEQMSFHRDVVAGTTVHQQITLENVQRKQARTGTMAVLTYRIEFRDSAGSPLITSVRTVLAR